MVNLFQTNYYSDCLRYLLPQNQMLKISHHLGCWNWSKNSLILIFWTGGYLIRRFSCIYWVIGNSYPQSRKENSLDRESYFKRILMVVPKIFLFLKLSNSKSLEWGSQDSRFLLSGFIPTSLIPLQKILIGLSA